MSTAMISLSPATVTMVAALGVLCTLLYLEHKYSSYPSGDSASSPGRLLKGTVTKSHFVNTQTVSLHDCKRELLPPHLTSIESTKEPVDYVLTTAYGYTPHVIRAFLKTFRKHNQAARIVILVNPDQVGPSTWQHLFVLVQGYLLGCSGLRVSMHQHP